MLKQSEYSYNIMNCIELCLVSLLRLMKKQTANTIVL